MRARHRHLNPGSAGAVLALDSRFISGLSDGDPVSTWSDRSGRGNNATGSETKRPTYKISQQGGQPSVFFDVTDDVIYAPYNYTLTSETVLVVAKVWGGASQWGRLFSHSDTLAFDYQSYVPLLRVGDENLIRDGSGNIVSTPQAWCTVISDNSGTVSRIIINGTVQSSASYAFAWTFAYAGIGSFNGNSNAETLNTDVASVCALPFSASDSLRRRLEHAAAFSFKTACS